MSPRLRNTVLLLLALLIAGASLWLVAVRERQRAASGAWSRLIVRSSESAQLFAARPINGSFSLLFDRDGGAIGTVANDALAGAPDFAPLVDGSAGTMTIGAHLPQLGVHDSIDTTLDPAVQRAALDALGSFRGSLVAIDPRTNQILAIASSRGKGAMADLALEQQYEPGSVVKVLTGLNAAESGVDLRSLFPFHCTGDLLIDGRHFGDWVPSGHGDLASIDQALAVSCNIVFADIGLRLGSDRVRSFLTKSGFDGQTDPGLYPVPLGRNMGTLFNHYETAFAAIGLEHETITTMHLAMLASMMANRGVLTTPRLLRARRSILGEVTAGPSRQASTRIASPAAAETMVAAMRAVVTDPHGTGRRAAVDGLTIAMKTGTAGKRENGYQALIMAFAPADSPKIAFGMIAEDAGPAEYAGAKIAHDFLERMKGRL